MVIPNQKLLEVVDKHVSMIDAFALINGILNQSVKGISDIISKPGHINVDFADVRTIMKDMGLAVMGTGRATGADRAAQAAYQAISSPLLENMSIKGAQGVLLNISGGPDLALYELGDAADIITKEADPHANIIVGSVIDPQLSNEIIITVIATGFMENQVTQKETATAYKPAIEQPKFQSKEVPESLSVKHESVKENRYEDDLDIPTFMRQSTQATKE